MHHAPPSDIRTCSRCYMTGHDGSQRLGAHIWQCPVVQCAMLAASLRLLVSLPCCQACSVCLLCQSWSILGAVIAVETRNSCENGDCRPSGSFSSCESLIRPGSLSRPSRILGSHRSQNDPLAPCSHHSKPPEFPPVSSTGSLYRLTSRSTQRNPDHR